MERANEIGLTLDRMFYQTLLRSPQKTIVYKNERRTYRELFNEVRKLSDALYRRYKPGTRIAVLDWNTIPYMQLLYGIPCSGNVIHPVNMRLPPEELIRTIRTAKDKALFFSQEFTQIAKKILEMGLLKKEDLFLIDGLGQDQYNSYSDLLAGGSEEYSFNLDEDSPASVLFTSGTTGIPKEIVYSHKKITLAIWSILTLMSAYPGNSRINSEDVVFSLIPNYHLWSWGTPYVATMIGANYVMDGKFDLAGTFEAINKNKVTWMSMVPTMLYGLLSHPSANKIKGLKVLVGGSPIPSGLISAATSKGVELTSIYGFSDGLIAGIGSLNGKAEDLGKRNALSTAGVIPAPLSEYVIKNSKEDEIGEIHFRSPWLPSGYEGDIEKSRESFTEDFWFRTGDAGSIKSGRVEISDRIKDLIKSGAEFIPSALVESAISDLPEIETVAVIGIPDTKWGERPMAFVKVRSDQKFEENRARDYLSTMVDAGKIQKWWIPDKFTTIDAMPMTGTGKIDKKALREISRRN